VIGALRDLSCGVEQSRIAIWVGLRQLLIACQVGQGLEKEALGLLIPAQTLGSEKRLAD